MKLALIRAFGAILITGFALAGCGKDDDKGSDAPRNNNDGDVKKPGDEEKTPPVDTSHIADGKYYLSAGTVEGFDTEGDKVGPHALQVTGDYFWIIKHIEGQKYEVTATGSAKISNSNNVVADLNCKGAQDVYVFDWTESGALRNLRQTETGCPQGLQSASAQQMSVERLSNNSFTYTVVTQEDGNRVIETYTFKK